MHHNYHFYVSCFSAFVKDKWQMSPILVHDKRSMINPGRLELDGSARTIILECTASIRSKDSRSKDCGSLFQSNCYTFIFNEESNFKHARLKCKTTCFCLKLEKLTYLKNKQIIYILQFFFLLIEYIYKLLLKQAKILKSKSCSSTHF